MYTLPRGVGVGCLRVLIEWFEWIMWRVVLSLAAAEKKLSGALGTGCL